MSLSYFILIKRLFSFSSLSVIWVITTAYLRLLVFLLAYLIPACASSSPAFCMTYSAHKLEKQGYNIQPWRTPFPIWNLSFVSCQILTVSSWPVYRLLRMQVRWSGIPISLRKLKSLGRRIPTSITIFKQINRILGGFILKNLPAKAGDMGLIPGLGRYLEKGMATTLVFLPGKSHGQRSLEGYSLWGCEESDMNERLNNNRR